MLGYRKTRERGKVVLIYMQMRLQNITDLIDESNKCSFGKRSLYEVVPYWQRLFEGHLILIYDNYHSNNRPSFIGVIGYAKSVMNYKCK